MEGGIFLLSREEFIRKSLELNLFYQRIMKEHLFFIETNLPCVETEFITEANILKLSFEEILAETVMLANGIISEEAIKSHEIVTQFTLPAEEITSNLTGASLNTNITKAELELTSNQRYEYTEWLENAVSSINRRSKNLLEEVIAFKNKMLTLVLQCKLALMMYPAMLNHLIEEAELYLEILECLMHRELPRRVLCDELNFWNHIMEEHAQFIDGMLDPSEEELKEASERFAQKFEMLVNECIRTPDKQIVQKKLRSY